MSSRRRLDALAAALLCSAITAPTVDQLLRSASARGPDENEYRSAARWPAWPGNAKRWNELPQAIQAWYADFFGLRDVLIRWHALDNLFVFQRSPTPSAVLGKDGWMFYADGRSLEIARGAAPLSRDDLAAWARAFEAQHAALEKRGIEYVLAFAPNKESIYPDRLPASMNTVGPSRLDQLLAYLRQHSDLKVADLRPALLAEKCFDAPDDHLYFAQGTHWYGRGALAAYREIVRVLRPSFPALRPLRDEEVREDGYGQDSWAQRMYVFDLFPQTDRAFVPRAPRATIVEDVRPPADAVRVTEVNDDALPRAVVLRDSMVPYFQPLLSEHFRRAAFLHAKRFDVERITRDAPDVVVVCYVERILGEDEPDLLRVENDFFDFDERFASAGRELLDLPRLSLAEMETRGTIEIAREERGVTMRSRTPGAHVLLQPLDPRDCDRVFVLMEIEAAERSFLTVAHKRTGDTAYLRARTFSFDLRPGPNRVRCCFAADDLEPRLALAFDQTREPLVFTALTIRGSRAR